MFTTIDALVVMSGYTCVCPMVSCMGSLFSTTLFASKGYVYKVDWMYILQLSPLCGHQLLSFTC